MANAQKATPTERMYQILVRPLVTEKTSAIAEGNWVSFEVLKDASKPEIRSAVETLYNVKVSKVNTLIQKGKVKTFKGIKGQRSDMKKAFIKLAEGQNIDIAAGV